MDSDIVLSEITKKYNADYNAHGFEFDMRVVQQGVNQVTHITTYGDHIIIENSDFEMVVDKDEHVILMKATEMILLRSNDESSSKDNGINDFSAQMDSLNKYIISKGCVENKLTMVFGDDKVNKVTVKKMVVEYTSDYSILSIEYKYVNTSGKMSSQKIYYENYQLTKEDKTFKGRASDRFMYKGELRGEYKQYQIKDLRKKKQ